MEIPIPIIPKFQVSGIEKTISVIDLAIDIFNNPLVLLEAYKMRL